MPTIKTNPFAREQHTINAPRGHYNGTWPELEALVVTNFEKARQGYREGIMLVPVPAEGFMSASAPCMVGKQYVTTYVPRRPEEDPFLMTTASQNKVPAVAVDIVLYSHAVLMEDNDASSDPIGKSLLCFPVCVKSQNQCTRLQ